MTSETHRPVLGSVSRVLTGLVAAAMLLALAPFVGTADAAVGEIEISSGDGLVASARFRGQDRFDTAELIATDDTDFAASYGGTTILVARGDVFADALSGSVLGGTEEAPIVLTPGDTAADGGELNANVQEAIDFYDDTLTDVFILGGESAVGPSVETAIEDEVGTGVTVTRLGGENRFETAQLIAEEALESADTAIVADGGNFPDALVSGAIAASAQIPILLNGNDGDIDPFTQQAIDDLGVDNIIIAGGRDAISESLEDDFDAQADVERVFGANRFETAVEFADFAVENFDFGTEHFNLARADLFPDALALGPHAGLDFDGASPILLTAGPGEGETVSTPLADQTELSSQTEDYLSNLAGCDTEALHVAGGFLAISALAEQEAREAVTEPGAICALDLTPESATNIVGETHTVTATPTDNAGEDSDLTETSTVTFQVDQIETGTAMDPETSTSNTAVPERGTATVGPDDNSAEFTFTSFTPGEFTITASTVGEDGETVTATAFKRFVLPDEAELPDETITAALAFTGGTGFGTFTTGDSNTTVDPETQTAFTGDAQGDPIVGLDYRPNDQNDDGDDRGGRGRGRGGRDLAGVLYALGESGTLYTVDGDGVATEVGDTGITGDLAGGVGFDFNPQVDKIRVVLGTGDENLVVDPDTGEQVEGSPFEPAEYDEGDPNEGTDPEVSAVAYTNSGLMTDGTGPDSTVEFAIDTAADVLVVKAKNAGTLFTVGVADLGVDAQSVNGFDIGEGGDIGYAVLTTDSGTFFYVIDLIRGEVIGDGVQIDGDFPPPVTGFSIDPTA